MFHGFEIIEFCRIRHDKIRIINDWKWYGVIEGINHPTTVIQMKSQIPFLRFVLFSLFFHSLTGKKWETCFESRCMGLCNIDWCQIHRNIVAGKCKYSHSISIFSMALARMHLFNKIGISIESIFMVLLRIAVLWHIFITKLRMRNGSVSQFFFYLSLCWSSSSCLIICIHLHTEFSSFFIWRFFQKQNIPFNRCFEGWWCCVFHMHFFHQHILLSFFLLFPW